MWMKITIPLALLALFALSTEAQTRKVRLRQQRPVQIESSEEDVSEERPVIQYYRSQPKQDDARELVYVNEEEYQNLYAQQQAPATRPRDYRPVITTVRPLPRASHSTQTLAPRSKVNEEKAPAVQTIRNFNKVNDDGSFTFGYEAADGSFKEETRGTDCVVRGKYGYVDPDGNKREFTYVSGNPCDPNNPDGEEEEEKNGNRSVEDAEENVPQNYPRRPVVPVARPRPTSAPTTRAPTTVFHNRYNAASEEEEDTPLHYAQIPKTTPRQQFIQQTQRPRIQVIQTTQAPLQQPINYASPTSSINITPKPLYKLQSNHLSSPQQSPQEPATTYRPHTVSIIQQKPQVVATTASPFKGVTYSNAGNKGSIDFDAEFKKFQQETGFQPITAAPSHASKSPLKTTSNPLYQSQLVYDPSTGQYDSNLYQSIPQSDGFQHSQRIQPFAPQPQYQNHHPQQQQQQQHQQQYFRPQPVAQAQIQPQHHTQQAQVPQQIYQKQQNEIQFLNSQQLFAQQLQMQQSQLQRDRVEAAKKNPSQQSPHHRFQLQSGEPSSPVLHRAPNGQQYYFIQPSSAGQSNGQIESFLRGHNIEY